MFYSVNLSNINLFSKSNSVINYFPFISFSRNQLHFSGKQFREIHYVFLKIRKTFKLFRKQIKIPNNFFKQNYLFRKESERYFLFQENNSLIFNYKFRKKFIHVFFGKHLKILTAKHKTIFSGKRVHTKYFF